MDYDDIAHFWKQKGLSVRASNVLAKARIFDETILLEKFGSYEKVLQLRNCGRLTAHEIWEFIELSQNGAIKDLSVPSYYSLSNRAKHVLQKIGIKNEEQLATTPLGKDDFFRLRNVGAMTCQEIWSVVEWSREHAGHEKHVDSPDNHDENRQSKLVPLLGSHISEDLWNALCHIPSQYIEWSVRTRKGIDKSGCIALADILSISPEEWLKIDNLGRGSLKELQTKIAKLLHDSENAAQLLTFSSENVHELPLLHRLVPSHIWYALKVIPLQDTEWAARTRHVLEEKNCRTLADIVSISHEEWLQQPNFGKKSLAEVIENISRILETLLHPKPNNPADITVSQHPQITSLLMFGGELLQWLKKRDQQVIKLYHGYDDVPKTLEEIGETFGLTRERIRQIKEKANERMLHKPRRAWLRKTLSDIIGTHIRTELEKRSGFCNIQELHRCIVEKASQEEQWVVRWLDEVFDDEQWLLFGSDDVQVHEGICRFATLTPQQEFVLHFTSMLRLYGYRPIRFDEYAKLYQQTFHIVDHQQLNALLQSHPFLVVHEYGEQYIGHKEWGWFLPDSRNSSSRTANVVEWFLRLTNTPTQATAIVHGIVKKIEEFSLDAAEIIDACEKEPERFVMENHNVCQLTLWEDAAQYTPKLQEMLGDAPLHIEKIVEQLSPENPEPVVAALHVNHEIFHEPMPFEWVAKKPETRINLAGLTCEDSIPQYDGQILQERRAGGDVTPTTSPEVACKPPSLDMIRGAISTHFPNGFRIGSSIELLRFRRFVVENGGDEISLPDEELKKSIADCGTVFDGKVYVIGNDMIRRIQHDVDVVVADGAGMIFYNAFYARHEEWLFAGSVISEDMLKHILVKLYPKFRHKTNYCSPKPKNRAELVEIRNEIMRIWGSEVTLNFEQLAERLPYIPLDKLKYGLAQNSDFVWNATGVYTHISKIEFDSNDRRNIIKRAEEEIGNHGYFSLALLDVTESLELNPELSETAVKNGLFQICLTDQYEKRGNIITLKGTTLNSVAVFKDYCLTHDRLTLDELLNFEKEINGSVHSQSLFVAYDTMIRVNKDTFVGDNEIDFDVDAIDNALARFVHSGVIPLRAVTSFISFPHIDGYPWNWFLLESYCRRFSKQYTFQCLSVNSRNVGAIFHKSAGFADYTAVLATAVADEDVRLDSKDVGDFLFESGYIARRTRVIHDVIARARILRERRVLR